MNNQTALSMPLEEKLIALNGVMISPSGFEPKLSLRCNAKNLAKVNPALGIKLPQKPKSTTNSAKLKALWLGPDEWLIIGETQTQITRLEAKLSKLDCSAVDVSHRNCAIVVSGPNTIPAINAGCPQNLNLEAFPVGACSRTIMGSAEIILYRLDEDNFHIECWRSFSAYVWQYLVDAAQSM